MESKNLLGLNITTSVQQLILNSKAFEHIALIGITGSVGAGFKSIESNDLNDVDYFVVSKSYHSDDKQRLEDELNLIHKTKFTDIQWFNTAHFFNRCNALNIDQYLFDLIYGASIIYYTNDDARSRFDLLKHKTYNITSHSATGALLTRLWCLLGPVSIANGQLVFHPELAMPQFKKMYASIIDATLIVEKKYDLLSFEDKKKRYETTLFYNDSFHSEDLNHLGQSTGAISLHVIYENLINLFFSRYLSLANPLIFKLNYPNKKELLWSFIHRSHWIRINAFMFQYKTLRMIKNATHPFDTVLAKKINVRLSKIYDEVMK